MVRFRLCMLPCEDRRNGVSAHVCQLLPPDDPPWFAAESGASPRAGAGRFPDSNCRSSSASNEGTNRRGRLLSSCLDRIGGSLRDRIVTLSIPATSAPSLLLLQRMRKRVPAWKRKI